MRLGQLLVPVRRQPDPGQRALLGQHEMRVEHGGGGEGPVGLGGRSKFAFGLDKFCFEFFSDFAWRLLANLAPVGAGVNRADVGRERANRKRHLFSLA